MVGPEHPLPVGQGALVQQHRVFLPSSGQAGAGQAAERGQRLGMIAAQGPLPFRQDLLLDADGVGRAARRPRTRRPGCSRAARVQASPPPRILLLVATMACQ